jgi:polysaccharide deacetylase 2 family uncharacterized protein YibQ
VAVDDLTSPLGQGKSAKRGRPSLPISIPQIVAGTLGLFLIVFTAWTLIASDPFGGEPMVVTKAPTRVATEGAAPVQPGADSRQPGLAGNDRPSRYDGPEREGNQPAAPGSKTVTVIDGTNGKRQEVVIPAQPDSKQATIDERLAEPSRHGTLPKVAQDGTRPADAFARPAKAAAGKPNGPQIAIVVSGLGISAAATSEALAKLPAAVTFAFAPYGSNVEMLASRARDGGHEFLLQVPMEPFDYPDNDPGPQTLLTSLDAGQNVDRLQWVMSRMQGYVGLVNQLGQRFTASEQALAPVLREVAKRGLIYLDDGSSPRSLASQMAGANNLGFAKADLVIDSVPTPADVDRALARLETIARDRGQAVGMANALPVSIDRLAKWAKALESRGVALVPISAAANRSRPS